jgi:hypothetical protein
MKNGKSKPEPCVWKLPMHMQDSGLVSGENYVPILGVRVGKKKKKK